VKRLIVLPVLECLSSFLLNTPLVENRIVSVVSELCIESLNTAKLCIAPLIRESLKSKDAILLQNSLLLAHSWGEAHLIMLNYNRAYARQWAAQVNQSTLSTSSFSDLSHLHFYLDANEWNHVNKACAEPRDSPSLYTFVSTLYYLYLTFVIL